MNEEQLEKKNKRTALVYTTIIQVVLLVVLFFIVAWRAPDPPLPEYGIELNFGTDDQGSGDIQPETPVGNEGQQEEEPEESKPKVQEEAPKIEAKETKPVEAKPVEEQIVSKVESPVVVKEKKEEEVKPVEKPAEKPVEKKVEPKVEEKPKVNPDAVYKPNAQQSTSDSKAPDSKAGKPGNHGDDAGKTGDKGNPEGNLDAKALYGKPGGGAGGSSLELSGWDWDEIPKPNVPNNTTGRIVFEITVNSQGELDGYQIVQNSLSPDATKACRDAVEKLTFTKTGTNVPAISKGKITFVVRAN
jgi:periplasmic protein TonB